MNKVIISRIILLSSYISLIIILLASTLASGGEHTEGTSIAAPIVLWLFKSLPLLIFIPGLISGSHKTASWLSYVTMIYFVLAILLMFTAGADIWGTLMPLTTLILFIAAMLYVRWKKEEEKTS
ncbi:MAG: hypothetical protein CMI14_06460 [Oleispira sp.]|nr:hypothetical protein [Oleispira sp.]|tara:strand:- start:26 stop:397 length:372 start_codon:yes stop_codon:yes gene_type:complete